jgi:hypothetical protein
VVVFIDYGRERAIPRMRRIAPAIIASITVGLAID